MKIVFLFVSVLIFSMAGMAQDVDTTYVDDPLAKQSSFDKSKLYYGGYLNLSFGSYTVVGATPLVGYKVSPKLSVGTQFTYEYVRDKRYTNDYEDSNYGISVFSRYRLFPQLYTHVEFSEMNYKMYYYDGGSTREWVPFLWLGGGYSQPVSRNVWLNAQVLFDVINHENSPYKDWKPYYSVGFGVGF
jgi:hypothetical protein